MNINKHYKEDYPHILAAIDLVLSLPSSTVECERGFSQLNMIKTDWRNRLNNSTVNDVMRVLLLSPSIDLFEPTAAVNLWFEDGLRKKRPQFNDFTRTSDSQMNEVVNDILSPDADSDFEEDDSETYDMSLSLDVCNRGEP